MLCIPEIRGFHFYVDGRKWLVRGVTYGPFRPREENPDHFPVDACLEQDMAAIAAMGANAVRIYTPPSDRVANAAARHGLRLLVDVPWPKHLHLYDDARLRRMAFDALDESLEAARRIPNLMGVLLGNEIPADLVRWVGAGKVERFLRSMVRHARTVTGDIPLGFANYPSTEYLALDFFDFLGFNIYLSEREDMRSYFVRLRNLYPEMPLILTETGEDSMAQGEEEQCRVVANSLTEAFDTGFAGGFVFSWTDEWHTGGFDINDWAFGIVDKKRRPKPLHGVVSRVYSDALRTRSLSIPEDILDPAAEDNGAEPTTTAEDDAPMVSVVVCTYNGGSTLRDCLDSLQCLNYPNYEVIVVNDGSTDDTAAILRDYPDVRAIHQENLGLSVARNVGVRAASGEIIAFTDSDCVVDEDWLHHLAMAFVGPLCAGVGGPNLTPWEENAIHRCVAHAPGHATHILFDAERAEHVPGCNMAFRRSALLQAKAFDPVFRTAGDDVDLIWRLQEAGFEVRYAPGAFVWHHRRSTIGAYLRQQAGYGAAEALLIRKHPHRFNDRGQSLWRGRIYSGLDDRALFQRPDIHYGVFASSGYQCIYTRSESYLTQFVTSLEWLVFCLFLLVMGFLSQAALLGGLAGIGAMLLVSGLKARRRFMAARDLSLVHFPVVWLLWFLHPLVRTGARYLAVVRTKSPDRIFRALLDTPTRNRFVKLSTSELRFWGQQGEPRIGVLQSLVARMREGGWLFWPSSGWEPWDLSVGISWSHRLLLTTASEDHGAGRQLLMVRMALRATSLFRLALVGVLLAAVLIALRDTVLARLVILAFVLFAWWLHRQALARRRVVAEWICQQVATCGYVPMGEVKDPDQVLEAGEADSEMERASNTTPVEEHVAP
jgi:glycosyltransferase involved in cell wall biosynthesis